MMTFNVLRTILLVLLVMPGLAAAADGLPFPQPKPACDPSISSCVSGTAPTKCDTMSCIESLEARTAFEKDNNCKFNATTKQCKTPADLFYEAIQKQEVSGNQANPNASNNFLPARNGEPASPGHPVAGMPYYSASYGSTQLTLGTLMPVVEKLIKTNTDCANTPTCIAPFITNATYKSAILSWDSVALAVKNAVCTGACKTGKPVATPGKNGPSFPPLPANSLISQTMWNRIAAWNYIANQIYLAHTNAKGNTSGYDIGSALLTDSSVIQMLNYLGMPSELTKSYPQPTPQNPKPVYHAPNDTVNNYINYGLPFYNKRPSQYPEAVSSFQTGAFFTAPSLGTLGTALFNNLLGSVFGAQCNKYFSMAIFPTYSSNFGSSGTLAQQDKWVRSVAGKWNGTGSNGTYANSVVNTYNDLVNQFLKNNQLTSLPTSCPGDAPATTNTCASTGASR